jgi:hypothetical protein
MEIYKNSGEVGDFEKNVGHIERADGKTGI